MIISTSYMKKLSIKKGKVTCPRPQLKKQRHTGPYMDLTTGLCPCSLCCMQRVDKADMVWTLKMVGVELTGV